MTNLLPTVSKITKTLLLFCWCFLSLSCSNESSSGDDMQDNGLAFMKQIVQPIKDNIKKEKEFWGDDETDDSEDTAENLGTYNEYGNTVKEQTQQIKDNPENTQAYLDLVEALDYQEIFNPHTEDKSQKKAYQEMTQWLTAGIKQHPDDKELYRERAKVYFKSEEFHKAKDDYTHIIKLDPQDGDAFKSRGQIHEQLGQRKEAQRDFETYAIIQPGADIQYYQRGLFYYMRGEFNLAEPAFTKYIESDPTKGSGEIFRAEIYFAQNRYDDSIADYKRMIELDPDMAGFGLFRIGVNYYYQGKYKLAEDTFVEMLKLDPSLGAVVFWYLSRQKQGKSSKAALDYIGDQFGKEHLERAVIHLFLNKLPPEDVLNKALEVQGLTVDQSSSIGHYYVGQYYLMRDSPSKAKTMFEKSIQMSKGRFVPGTLFSEKELARMKSNNTSGTNDQN